MTDEFDEVVADLRRFSGTDAELTAPILAVVRVTGASLSTMGFLAAETIAASDRVAARIDEAQLDLGEGPCWDAVASGLPVLEPDLQNAVAPHWPALADSLRQERIGGVYAFPLSVGTLAMGAIDLYHAEPRRLDARDIERATTIATVLGPYVLRRALLQVSRDEPPEETSPFSRRLVHQATGYVVAQLGVSVADALLLIQGQAFATGRPLRDVAEGILSGRQRFSARGDRIEGGRMTATHDDQLFDAFASLADTLVADYDVVGLLQLLVETCQGALDVAEAGILLANESGDLELVAATSESTSMVETIQLAAEQGPCIRSFRSGEAVSIADLDTDTEAAWPDFRRSATDHGFGSVYAIPLRLRSDVIGTLNLFGRSRDELGPRDLRAAQALADVATIGILHERSFRANDVLREQLQLALDSRVVIEQAKGVLAQTHGISPEEAFGLLRAYARTNRMLLAEVARRLVQRSLIF